MKTKTMKNKTQSGRSMIEMLGVLAIVGVLSVGAMAGYSMAITSYKATQAAKEIRKMIDIVQDLYADKNNYEGLIQHQVCNAGLWAGECKWGVDPQNIFNHTIGLNSNSVNGISGLMVLIYTFSSEDTSDADTICRKILLAGWSEEFGHNLVSIITSTAGPIYHNFLWTGGGTHSVFPIDIDEAFPACENITSIRFYVK
jgi:type II secretory pathway pseudopilin PulG